MNKVIIIGAGPAGISAAIQLKRFGIEVLIIEKNSFGGLLKNANLVENYLGFPEGISGTKLVSLMQKQFKQYNISLLQKEVLNIAYSKHFTVKTTNGLYESKYLILATGTKPNLLTLDTELKTETKLFYDVYSIQNVKNKDIAIIGAGDAAFDYAINLSKNNKIKILNRNNKIKALELLYKRCLNNPNIDYFENITVQKIKYHNDLFALITNKGIINADYLIAAIGRNPDDKLLTKELKDNSKLFIIGDVKNGILRQTAIAVGDGLKVAQLIHDRERQKGF